MPPPSPHLMGRPNTLWAGRSVSQELMSLVGYKSWCVNIQLLTQQTLLCHACHTCAPQGAPGHGDKS